MTWLTIPLAAVVLGAFAPGAGIYLDVPFVHQSPRQCGPAALAMSLRYWDYDIDHTALAAAISNANEGVTGSDLERLARAHGFSTRTFAGTDEQLRHLLQSGRPVIVALAPSSRTGPNHFVVVVGATAHEWLIHDPSDGPYRRIGRTAFARRWSRLNNWSLLVDRHSAAESTATVAGSSSAHVSGEPFWKLASVYFRQRRNDEARDVLRQGLAHAPRDVYGHDFLATLLYLDGRTVEALHHWNIGGAPLVRRILYLVPDAALADTLSRLYRVNEGERLTRAQWIDAAWLQGQLLPRQNVRWSLVPTEGDDWSLQIDVMDPPLRSWKAQALRNAFTAALDRELSLDMTDTGVWGASVAVRWDPARQRVRAAWQRLFVNAAADRLRLAVDVRDEAWKTTGSPEPIRLRSGEFGLSYDYFLTSRRSVSADLAYLRHTATSFVVGGLSWQQTAGLDAADRVRLQWTARVDAYMPLAPRTPAAQRFLASASIGWNRSGEASTTAGVRLSTGAIHGELPPDRQFVFGVGPDAPLLLRAHPTLHDGMKGGSPAGRQFGLLNVDVERRLLRAGGMDVRALLFADHAAVGRHTYTDAGGGIRLRAWDQTIEVLAGRDLHRATTRFRVGLSHGF